jgi:hypothetical protein
VQPSPPDVPAGPLTDERRLVLEVLQTEYPGLMSALNAAWSASLVRTSLFLGVLSAAGVAAGFAAQGGLDDSSFALLLAVAIPLVPFLGVTTFVRLVQVQRESTLCIIGMNRIRHYLQECAPASRPYFVLPAHDDETAVYRGIGTGVVLRPPRSRLAHLVVQTQGIVGVVTAAVAAVGAGLAVSGTEPVVAWGVALVAFVATLAVLLAYWQRSLAQLRAAIRPAGPDARGGARRPDLTRPLTRRRPLTS